MNGYVKFTGEYNKLKSMGFEFQKLYAANYMQWNKNGIRVWKRGGDITFDSIDLYKLITFMKDNPRAACRNDCLLFYKLYDKDDRREYELLPFNDENHEKYREWFSSSLEEKSNSAYMSSDAVLLDDLRIVQEFHDLGWYELVEVEDES